MNVPAYAVTRLKRRIQHAQDAVEFVAAAHDVAGRGDHAIGALAAREFGMFLDPVDRKFGGAPENGKHRAVLQEINRVIAPLAVGDLASIETQDAIEFAPFEGDLIEGGGGRTADRGRAPAELARVTVAEAHAAPPFMTIL